MEEDDERTFLCGYQNSPGYGSTSCLQTRKKNYCTVVRHKVEPTDTLRGIVLKYNTSMTELKRMNRLWSNESLFLKEFVDVPIYDNNSEAAESSTYNYDRSHVMKQREQPVPESVEELFKRIDLTIKTTSKNVKKLEKNMSMEWDRFENSTQQKRPRHSINAVTGYQPST